MDKHLTSTLTVAATLAYAACLATQPVMAASSTTHPEITIAQNTTTGETTAPEPASPKDDAATLQPPRYPETPAEVAECMKSWDAETGMSRAEYEAACKRTLKYYPETPNAP
jgi:hypothetical protein